MNIRALYEKIRRAQADLTLYQRVMGLFCLFLLGLYPLLGGNYDGLTGRKTVLLLAAGGVTTAALLYAALRHKPGGQGASLPQDVSLPLAGLLLISALSALASPCAGADALLGQGRSGGLAGLALMLALGWAAFRWGRGLQPAYITALALSAAIISLLAWLQLAGLDPLDLYPPGYDYYDGDILYPGTFLSTIGNTGQLSAFYCLALPLLAGAALHKRGWRRWLLLGLLAASLPIIIRARMEAAMAGLVMGGLLALALTPRRASRRWLALAGLAALAALALLAVYHYAGPEQGSLWELSRLLHGEWDGNFGSMRLGIWRDGWRLFTERPWLGWGPGCFRQAYAWLGGPQAAAVDAAHNEYLGLLAETGVFSLPAYGAALVCAIGRLFSRGGLSRWCAVALLCYGIQAAFSFPTLIVAPLFWLIGGLGLGEAAAESRARGVECGEWS